MAVFLVAIFTVACGGKVDPAAYELYNSAVNALEAGDGFALDSYSESSVVVNGGDPQDKTVNTLELEVSRAGGNTEMMETVSVDQAGLKHELSMYYKDGFYYMNNDGDKIRYSAAGQGNMPSVDDIISTEECQNIPVFPESAIRESSIEESNGLKNLSFTVKGEALPLSLNGGAAAGDPSVDGKTVYDDAVVTAIIEANGNLSQTAFVYTVENKPNGNTTKTTTVNACIITQNNVKVDFPDDLSAYNPL